MSTILLSIKPEYTKSIISGEKKYEFRKFLAKHHVDKIIIYETSPTQAIVGEVEVKGTLSMRTTPLWEMTKAQAGISRQKYRHYFSNVPQANAYILGKAIRYGEDIPLSEFGLKQAPQSFVYLKKCPYCGNVLSTSKCFHGVSASTSEEHILPFSLGNSKLVIPRGIICDSCNNYFARKIEKPFLELEPIKLLRSYHTIISRKNRIPDLDVLIDNKTAKLEFDSNRNCCFIGLTQETLSKLTEGNLDCFITKTIDIDILRNNYVVSRFLVKIFTEMYLSYAVGFHRKNGQNDVKMYMFDKVMSQLFEYVRQGDKSQRVYKYSVQKVKKVKPFTNDDFVANIRINFTSGENKILGMTLTLFEVKFDLLI